MVRLTECKQLRKHPEPQSQAKNKAWCFSTSEIKISCDTELQTNVSPLIYNTLPKLSYLKRLPKVVGITFTKLLY